LKRPAQKNIKTVIIQKKEPCCFKVIFWASLRTLLTFSQFFIRIPCLRWDFIALQ